MTKDQKELVDYVRQCFTENHRETEINLKEQKEEAHGLISFRHHYAKFTRYLLLMEPLLYWLDRRKYLRAIRDLSRRLRIYRKVEADLERGKLESAIQALEMLAPAKETTVRKFIRLMTCMTSTSAIQHARTELMREKMLELRDQLIRINQTT